MVEEIRESTPLESAGGTSIVGVISTFLLLNIPTAILVAIYAVCREKRKKSLALEKMTVQDLE